MHKLFAAAAALAFAGSALAGDYAQGFGKDVTEASNNALAAAEKAVKSRGRGCVGPGKDGQPGMRLGNNGTGKQGELYVMEAHYNHHDGTCGKKKTIAEYRKELGI